MRVDLGAAGVLAGDAVAGPRRARERCARTRAADLRRARGGRSTRARRWPSNGVARQAATIPAADPGAPRRGCRGRRARLHRAASVRAAGPPRRTPDRGRRARWATARRIDDVRVRGRRRRTAPRLSDAILRTTAENLARRIASRAGGGTSPRTNFRDMLSGAQLADARACWPTRCAARRWRRWGRWSGIPVAPDSPAAFRLDVVPMGGAPNDRALSLRVAARARGRRRRGGRPARHPAGRWWAGRRACCRCRSRSRPRRRRSRRPRCWASRWACRRCRSMRARWRSAAILALAVTLARRRDRSADGGRA